MDTFSVDENTRAALVRRNTFLLMGSQAALLGAGAVWFSLAVVAASDLAGKERWAGIFLAMYNLFVAGSALLVGRMMDRRGRRPGLVLGHALMAIGGGAGGLAVWADSLWGLFLAATVFGAGYGAALLGRVAAADMVPAERRGRVVGVVVSAGVLGAIGGAPLVAVIEHAGGAPELAWVTIPAFALAGVLVTMKLRPDPQQLAVEEESTSADLPTRPLRELLEIRPLRAAMGAIAVAQTAMVAIMGVTPVALDDEGFGPTAIAAVISLHIAGMYALAPVIGAALDRYGRRPGLLSGCALSAAGALVGSFSGEIVARRDRDDPGRPRLGRLLPGRDRGRRRPDDGRGARHRARRLRPLHLARRGGRRPRERLRARVRRPRPRRHRHGRPDGARGAARAPASRALSGPLGDEGPENRRRTRVIDCRGSAGWDPAAACSAPARAG